MKASELLTHLEGGGRIKNTLTENTMSLDDFRLKGSKVFGYVISNSHIYDIVSMPIKRSIIIEAVIMPQDLSNGTLYTRLGIDQIRCGANMDGTLPRYRLTLEEVVDV